MQQGSIIDQPVQVQKQGMEDIKTFVLKRRTTIMVENIDKTPPIFDR